MLDWEFHIWLRSMRYRLMVNLLVPVTYHCITTSPQKCSGLKITTSIASHESMDRIIWTGHSRRCSTISGNSAGMTENRLGAGTPEERPHLGSHHHPLSHHLPLTSPTSPAVFPGLSQVAILEFSTVWRSQASHTS